MRNNLMLNTQMSGEVMQDKITSPIGLYLASYLIIFIESNESREGDQEKKFVVWEDKVIVKADSLKEAYDKVLDEVKRADHHQGDTGQISFSCVCEGVTEFLPIHEVFQHGFDVIYQEDNSTRLKYMPFTSSDQSDGYLH